MKKVTKMAAALAAVMMVMALAACSHDGGSSLASLSAAGSSGTGTGTGTGTGSGSGSGSGTGTGSTSSALTGTWTALTYATSTTYTDNLTVDDGTKLGAVTVSGTGAKWRTDSAGTKWSHLELGKAAAGCLKFTIGAASKVVVEAASTGGSNTSDIVLTTKDDTEGTFSGDANTVTNSNYISVTYETVPAGTYYLGAFPAITNGRGVRIKSITVTAK